MRFLGLIAFVATTLPFLIAGAAAYLVYSAVDTGWHFMDDRLEAMLDWLDGDK